MLKPIVLFEHFVWWCNCLILGVGCTSLCRLEYSEVTYFSKIVTRFGVQKTGSNILASPLFFAKCRHPHSFPYTFICI